jgi:hypothetical protein
MGRGRAAGGGAWTVGAPAVRAAVLFVLEKELDVRKKRRRKERRKRKGRKRKEKNMEKKFKLENF